MMLGRDYKLFRKRGPGSTPNSRVVWLKLRADNFKVLSDVSKMSRCENITRMPNRYSTHQSLAQSLAGTGALVFEGELLEL